MSQCFWDNIWGKTCVLCLWFVKRMFLMFYLPPLLLIYSLMWCRLIGKLVIKMWNECNISINAHTFPCMTNSLQHLRSWMRLQFWLTFYILHPCLFFFFFLQRLRLDEEKAEDWCQVFFNMKLKCVKQNCWMHAKRWGGKNYWQCVTRGK